VQKSHRTGAVSDSGARESPGTARSVSASELQARVALAKAFAHERQGPRRNTELGADELDAFAPVHA
jgi:hypothetical protein